MSDFDDFDVDNPFDRDKSKRKNSKKKGNRGELQLCKLLSERFHPHEFSRTPGSGNRWAQVRFVKKDFLGDIVCPDTFRFVLECKHGYPDIDLHNLMEHRNKKLDGFFQQAMDESERANLPPMLCWKKDRIPWLAFVLKTDLPQVEQFSTCLYYDAWVCLSLKELLKLDNEFFFTG